MKIVKNLAKSDRFENFLKIKFSDKKRFGLEGIDSLIPGLRALIEEARRLPFPCTPYIETRHGQIIY